MDFTGMNSFILRWENTSDSGGWIFRHSSLSLRISPDGFSAIRSQPSVSFLQSQLRFLSGYLPMLPGVSAAKSSPKFSLRYRCFSRLFTCGQVLCFSPLSSINFGGRLDAGYSSDGNKARTHAGGLRSASSWAWGCSLNSASSFSDSECLSGCSRHRSAGSSSHVGRGSHSPLHSSSGARALSVKSGWDFRLSV